MNSKILLIDEDPSVASALTGVLESEGFDVVHEPTTDEALAAFRLHGDFALVLLDVSASDEDGWNAFDRLSRLDPLVPIFVLTAESHQQAQADAAGVDALMEKPPHIPRMLETIRCLLSGRRTFRPQRTAVASADRPGAELLPITRFARHRLHVLP